jgi:2-methylaconitate cis-trans-isomerase PrpF
VRIHNTNTKKVIHARFPVVQGTAEVDGDLEIPGVAGTGAPVRLEFLEPGGATTGKLLPTGNVRDVLEVPGVGRIEASMVDVANACVFVRARDLGITGTELPDAVEADPELMRKLHAIRVAASLAMGIAGNAAEAERRMANPGIGFVSPAQDATLLSGTPISAGQMDFSARMLAKGQAHRALPLTRTLCMAAAARIEGTVVHEAARASADPDTEIRIGMPSGVLVAAAVVRNRGGQWSVERGVFLRTQRRLFQGHVFVRSSRTPNLASLQERQRLTA